jgi:DNA-binding SARP family transcriptional activator
MALITLGAIMIGLPIGLLKLGGSPIPARLPSWHQVTFTLLHQDNGGLFIGAVRDVSWIAWLAFAIAVIAEAQAAVRGRRAPRLRLAGLQGMAAKLVTLAALTFTAPAAVTLVASSAMAATVQSATPVAHHDHAPPASAAEKVVADRAIVVRPGDCLWTIAEHYLGAGDRYLQIAQLNLGHAMGNGQVFTDPSVIEAGWHLQLPESAGPAGPAGHSTDGSSRRGASEHSPGNHRTASGRHDGHPSAHSRYSSPHQAAGHSAGTEHEASVQAGAPGAGGTSGAGGTQAAGSAAQPGATASDRHDQVAEAALFTLGMLAGAALASIDRMRHRQRQYRRPNRRIGLPANPAGRGIEQKLRAAAARWPVDRSWPPDQADDAEPAGDERPSLRPQWPDLPGQPDLRGPAGNKIPPGGLTPFDAAGPFGYFESDDDQFEADRYGEPDEFGDDDRYEPDGPPARTLGDRGTPASLRDALRDLSEGIAVGGEPLPPIVGIHLAADTLEVLLSAPAATPPPAPFTIAPARQAMCWTVSLGGADQEDKPVPPVPGEVGDLLPGLFTAGATEAGGYLLLDLEAMRVTCCDGPDDLTDRLLVTAATELASSHWSGWYDLVLAGCDELDVLGRAELCSDLDQALEILESRAQAIARRMDDNGAPDVRTRRLADPDDEDWGLTLLVSRMRPTPGQMSRLLDLADGPGGIAALVAGDTQSEDGKLAPAVFQLAPDPQHANEIIATITLAYLGPQHQITVWPQTLTVPEYQALAGVFATAADTADVGPDEQPYNDFGAAPWIRLAAAPVAPAYDGQDEEFDRPAGDESPNGMPGYFGAEVYAEPDGYQESGKHHENGGYRRLDEWAAASGTPRAHGAGPRHAAPSLRVKVLGSVEITGSAEPLLPKQAELVLALALHAPVGVSNSGLCGLLGPDADHPRPADSVRQLITRTRKRLGQARDGQEFIIHLGSGIYVPHGDLTLDWANFNALAKRGRAERSRADLRTALALVRGEPFADCYHWWIDIGLIETIRAEIVDTAELASQLELNAGDPRAAAQAARAGLSAETSAEQLWRALMRAEYEAGNHDGVAAAWTGCLDAIAEIAPGGEPHPDTEQLFRELTRGAPIGSLR